MAVINEIIRQENDGTLSFGDYLAKEKKKVSDFDADGDLYKVKTYDQITRLEKNGKILLETVPGATIHRLDVNENTASFVIEGFRDTEITMELLPERLYGIVIDGTHAGNMTSGLSGKVNFSVKIDKLPLEVNISLAE